MLARLVLVALFTALAAPAGAADRPEYTGDWTYAGGSAEREARRAAIESVVADAPRLVRSYVRDRLLANTAVPQRISMAVAQCLMEVQPDQDRAVQSTIDGPAVSFQDPETGFTTVSRTAEPRTIVEVGRREGGERTARYRIDGDTLRIDVVLEADLLPAPVAYRLTYRRDAAVASR